MFKRILIITFLMSTFLLSSCSMVTKNIDETIVSPTPKKTEITGTWLIKKYSIIDDKIAEKSEGDSLVNTNISFGDNYAFIGGKYVTNLKYKLKIINYYNKYIEVENKDAPVVSVIDESNELCNFAKISNNSGYILYRGLALEVEKISSVAVPLDQAQVTMKESTICDSGMNKYYYSPVGILLGLKTPRDFNNSSSVGSVKYRTIWINFDGGKLEELKEKEGLLVPRLKGFWNLNERSVKYKNKIVEELEASQVDKQNDDFQARSKTSIDQSVNNDNLYREIMFVGNDYVSTETYKGEKFNNYYSQYKVLPIDNIKSSNGVDLSSLLGTEAIKAYDFSKSLSLSDQVKATLDSLNVDESNYENYAMTRRSGHWVLQGKVEAKEANKIGLDFYISFQPTKKLVNYDKLYVSWNKIKETFPSTRDAYTSPNERLALIINRDYLYIYEINEGNLADEPIQKIKLNEGETVVMAEWAYGDYVNKWDKVVNSFNETKKILK